MGVLRWLSKKVKRQDLYEKPIALTLNGKSKIQTLYGGAVSSIIEMILMSSAIFITIAILSKSETK